MFGRDLFTFKKEPGQMYDFAQHGLLNDNNRMEYAPILQRVEEATETKKNESKKEKKLSTPKEIYDLKALNSHNFQIQCDEKYIDEQVEIINAKLEFLGKEPKAKKSRRGDIPEPYFEMGGVKYGREELESIKARLINRKKISEVKATLEKYPHTTSDLISKVLQDNINLRTESVGRFVPDLPREAMQSMKEYNTMCVDLCDQKTNFYIIADQKDFVQVNKKRDPILLAQSPFGHFWQILGAWDKEMVFLADL